MHPMVALREYNMMCRDKLFDTRVVIEKDITDILLAKRGVFFTLWTRILLL